MHPAPDPSILTTEEVARLLDTDVDDGLTAAAAAERLARDGRNELRAAPRIPTWRRLLGQLRDPLIYLLFAAAGISLLAWMAEGMEGAPIDALVITGIILINALLGHAQEAKAENAVAALAKMTAATASVLRDGQVQRIPAAELVRGDILVLGEGDAVGADARLLRASALKAREAALTGESHAVLKEAATLGEPLPLADRTNMVFKGTAIVEGTGHAIVTATGMGTEMGMIAGMLDSAREESTPLQKEIGRVGRMLGLAVIAIAAIVVAATFAVHGARNASDAINILLLGVSLAVAAVPEGLPAILSVVLALGVQRMARHQAVVKKLSSVETLGSASVIASDKTGTLTRSEMTIQRIATFSGQVHASGVGYAPSGRLEHEGAELSGGALLAESAAVLLGGSLANNAGLRRLDDGSWEIQGDPTEAAFLVAERKLPAWRGGVPACEYRLRRFERIGEIPFSSERKMMSTLEIDHERNDTILLVAKGAPDTLLERCDRVQKGSDAVPLDDATRRRILADVDALSDAALRTLSVAYRELEPGEHPEDAANLEKNLVFAGTVGMMDPPREEAAAAIGEARRAGIRVIMITGDHPRTAARVAADLGIAPAGARALTGAELDTLSEPAFREAVRQSAVYARVAPAHKLRIVDALQADGCIVAMTGDGVNDAPALKAADIGIAMGVNGTEVTKEAAKMILADDNFATIVHAVREGRGIFDNIRKCLRYLLSSNMGEVLTIFLGVVLAGTIGLTTASGAVVLPLLATQILWVNLITDSGPALAMGMDPEIDDVMARRPRPLHERVIDARMWAGVLGTGMTMAAVTLLTLDMHLPGGLVEGDEDIATARSAAFTTLVLAQLFNCLNARSETLSAFRHLSVNPWLWAAIGISALAQIAVVNADFLNVAFGTVPLEAAQWLWCVALASVVLWAAELRKLAVRRLRPASADRR
ncbi:cation-translocating P-type ATPase [Parapusillimonas granuli]|uniref:Cation-translocating P-type ATPase n=1 Tax=Parapusillimonas granuli TaxID=380911 RepID=A0A853G224_9BURK|nr:cation-translocating P-type ATPase [Parapusillimonas granuli]MBB5217285.1 magnesium-transporting ATPase (P-type) [Parapusillimonas granuli]MEB2399298.1 cation-translocating P-type ATPase [Alcaligenaceae bacterium]NYT50923.1 cation-translocating P-type ATPase [Parapusillimonas granuli]